MDVYRFLALALTLAPVIASAQVLPQPRRTIRAFGQGEVAVRPDQARVQVSVVTRATTADEASQQNATRAAAVIDAVKKLIGNAGEVRTAFYNVSPYSEGNPPRQTGFQVTNSLLVITNNITIAGRIIDTAIQAGANRVDFLSLGLRDDDPVRLEALRVAGQKARQRAEAIASGLGVRIGQVLNADEGSTVRPTGIVEARTLAAAAPTPVEPGTLTVIATVTVEYEIVP